MKLADHILRGAYTDAISGNVTYNGKVVPIYDRVPNDEKPPWIKFGSFLTSNDSDKDVYSTDILIALEVHTAFKSRGGKKMADLISTQITQLIIDQPLDLLPDFICHQQSLESSDFVEDVTGDAYIYDKILIINNSVQQIT